MFPFINLIFKSIMSWFPYFFFFLLCLSSLALLPEFLTQIWEGATEDKSRSWFEGLKWERADISSSQHPYFPTIFWAPENGSWLFCPLKRPPASWGSVLEDPHSQPPGCGLGLGQTCVQGWEPHTACLSQLIPQKEQSLISFLSVPRHWLGGQDNPWQLRG